MGRAERRKNKERMKRKAVKLYDGDKNAIALADHLTSCSCFLCGNTRTHEGAPMREKRQPDVDDFDDEMGDE